MMNNSPYLDQDRELDVLLKLLRDYDSTTRQFAKLPEIAHGGSRLAESSASRTSVKAVGIEETGKAGSLLKRAS